MIRLLRSLWKVRQVEPVEPVKPKLTLESTLRPDPESRERRFAQWDSARRERYLKANEGLIR